MPFQKLITMVAAGVFLAALSGCSEEKPATAGAKLYEGIDTYSKQITTDSDEAQKMFNQGLVFLYGFNHDEATRSLATNPPSPLPLVLAGFLDVSLNLNTQPFFPLMETL